jgi:hypothetical protein
MTKRPGVAIDVLDQPPPAGREVEDHFRRMQAERVEVDHVGVGLLGVSARDYSP